MSRGHRFHRTAAWRQLRLAAFHRDGYACVLCGKRSRLECDHIVRLEDEGTNDLENLRTVCRGCHIAINADANRVNGEIRGQDEWARFARGRR
ncbi:MAG: HNH endonuclease [Gemmatimonadales bacterium]|nr:HNH endonuclease [Candidatus Palauibacter ramosifaciens]